MQAAVLASSDGADRQDDRRSRRRAYWPVGSCGCRLDREQATARHGAGEPMRPGLAASCARRLGDAVDAAAFFCGRCEGEPELFLQGSGKHTAHGMTLPASHARHLVDRGALGLTQHGNYYVLLRGALWVGARLRIGQPFDRRPQLIDQRLAVTNLSPLIDTGQRVPQYQKPLAVERGGLQFLLRRDDDLTLAGVLRHSAMPSLPMM